MSEDDESHIDWRPIAEWFNRHNGYASGFHHKNSDERAFVENIVAVEWCKAMRQNFDLVIGPPRPNRDDPPDFHVSIDGREIGLELVQLVSEENLRRAVKGEHPYHGALFTDCQWTKGGFRKKLAEILAKKGRKYCNNNITIDVLVVMVLEPWLEERDAVEWLQGFDAPRYDSIRSACLLFEYMPGRGTDAWPLQWVYGDCPPHAGG